MIRRARLSRSEKKNQTRTQLIRAAGAVFAKRGYGAATLDEVADRAGLTKGAVYSNFDGKADLALAVLDERVTEPTREIFGRVDAAQDFEAQHVEGGKLLVEALDASAPAFRLELECAIEALSDPALLSRIRGRDEAIRQGLGRAIATRMEAAGWIPLVDMEVIVRSLVAVSNGIALQRLKDRDGVPDELLGQLIAAVYAGFARPAKAQRTRS